MQTFLPYFSFKESAGCLDNKRLGKQRVEVLQILNCLLIKPTRWRNHPAVKMWENSELILIDYGLTICNEWKLRSFKDTCYDKIANFKNVISDTENRDVRPWWLGNDKFHDSHKSNLLRKKPEHYSKFGWGMPDDLPYFWPTKQFEKIAFIPEAKNDISVNI